MPDHRTASSNKFMFRFTQDEVAEMDKWLEDFNNASPAAEVLDALAVKFSKTRHQEGKTYVRYESVQNWFRKRRHAINKARKAALHSVKSSKLPDPSSAAEMEESPMPLEDELKNDDQEASCKRNSGEESSEGGSRHIVSTSSVTNFVDDVLARLAKFKRVQPEACRKTYLGQHCAVDKVHQARATLEKLAGTSLVDFKYYQRDFGAAIGIIVEQGLLSNTEKTELMLRQERILKIVKENEHAREEIHKCNVFMEELTEAEESANKLMKKADILKEKYNKIPQEMCDVSCKISELEAALVQAKAELEIIKGDQDDVASRLAELCESLESANSHYMSLKSEEDSMIKKRIRTEERLDKNTEEWVGLTHSRGFTDFEGGL